MRLLFVGPEIDVFEFFHFVVNFHFSHKLDHAPSANIAIDKLMDRDYALVIVSLPQEEPGDLFTFLRESEVKIPILFTGSNQTISESHRYIKHHPLTAKVSYHSHDGVVSRVMTRLLKVYSKVNNISEPTRVRRLPQPVKVVREPQQAPPPQRPPQEDVIHLEKPNEPTAAPGKEEYCPIPIGLVQMGAKSDFDIFIKIDEDIYELLFQKGNMLKGEDIIHLVEWGHTHIYLSAIDFFEMGKELMGQYQSELKPSEVNTRQLGFVANFAHDSICRLLPEMGLKEEILEMAGSAIDNVQAVVKGNFDLKILMKQILKGDGYNSEHTIFTTYLSCAVIKETEWFSSDAIDKLSLASFFHDISLDEAAEDLALSDHPEKVRGIAETYIKNYLAHPYQALKVLDQIDGISDDVNKIIVQHHERPDGSGFPHGLDWKKISPLSAVFIISEDFANCIYSGGKDIEFMHELLDEFEKRYTIGNFAKAMHALRVALGIPKLPEVDMGLEQRLGA